MAERKPLFIGPSGFHEEMATTDTATFGGLTLGGDITMGGNKVVDAAAATAHGEVLVYGQGGALVSGLNLGGNEITNLAPGTTSTSAVTLSQLDSVAAGLDFKESVRAATESALAAYTRIGNTITADANGNIGTVDGVNLVNGDRILLQDGASNVDNGIYVVTASGDAGNPYILDRADDANTSAEVTAGMFMVIEEGTNNGDKAYVLSTNDPITLNTTGLDFTLFSTLADLVEGDGIVKTGNTIAVDLTATPGLEFSGGDLQVKDGDGIEVTANGVEVDLVAASPGLEFSSGELQVQVVSSGAIIRQSDGIALKLDETPDTLDMDSDGLKVVGLPSLFKINDTAVGGTVTATNLDTVTDGSNANGLHTHSGLSASSAERVEDALAVDESIAIADPVYWTATGDRVGKALANDDSKSWVIGLATTAQASVGANATIVAHGEAAGVLSGATPGTPYYLQATGGIGTSVPGSNNRVILIGFAVSADDLWVRVTDYGKKAA